MFPHEGMLIGVVNRSTGSPLSVTLGSGVLRGLVHRISGTVGGL
jgi:hypothetical protein